MDRMQQAAKDKGKDLAVQQGNFFLRLTRKLGWEAAPSKDDLWEVYRRLKGKLRRKKGKTPLQEIMRRIRARGTFARGWKTDRVENTGTRIRSYIGNAVKYAGIVDGEKKVADRAADTVGGTFKRKLQKLAEQVTGVF
jgi:hypothetical protein